MAVMATMTRMIVCAGLVCASLWAADEPFDVKVSLTNAGNDTALLVLDYTVAPGHHLYRDMMSVAVPEGVAITAVDVPDPVQKFDPLSEGERGMYAADFTEVYGLQGLSGEAVTVTVNYQGCSETVCFMPTSRQFTLPLETVVEEAAPAMQQAAALGTVEEAAWDTAVERFKVGGLQAGYLNTETFLGFLQSVEAGEGQSEESIVAAFRERGVLLSLVLFLIGGLLLNLTPCVLPMIPITIGVIGAGAQASSKARGFALGTAYGLGIALSYGLLGVIVILSGGRFGTLNANPWFNVAIAVVFVVLALAMFDVIMIDFTKYQHAAAGSHARKGTFFAALFIGAVMALLAGSCVAPVVIQVLIVSASLYSQGNTIALFLPFMLGVGMALPWPFAGAGLSFLPKPGAWMTRVKFAFGVAILAFALYYGYTAYHQFHAREEAARAVDAEVAAASHAGWLTSLPQALAESKRNSKPVFIDFWATWCKNCVAMDKTTFKDPRVIAALEHYVKLKYQAENPSAADTKAVLDHFGVRGLPTYVVLVPESREVE
jgi:thiol:disulfide interchange protein DsbD